MARKSGLGLLVAILLCGGFFGCRKPRATVPPPPPPRWSGVAIRVACTPGPAHRVFEIHGRTWARDNGAHLTIVAPAEAADIVVMPPFEMPAWADAGKLRPLPDASVTAAFLPLYRGRLLNWDNRTCALPVLGDGLVCIYRADLFANTAERTAYKQKHQRELAPPETWNDFADQAAFFAERRGKASLPSIVPDDRSTAHTLAMVAAPFAVRAITGSLKGREFDLTGHAPAFSFQYDTVTGEPRIASQGFVEALKLLERMQPYRSKKVDRTASLRDDEAVMGIVTLDELAGLRTQPPGRWGVVRMPGSRRVFAPGTAPEGFVNVVPYVGSTGALAGVPQTSTCPEAAFDLLVYLSSETVSQEIVHNPLLGGGPIRETNLTRQMSGWLSYGLDEANTSRLRDALRDIADPRLDNPALALRIPDEESHRKALAAAVRDALQKKADPTAALADVERQWRRLDGDAGKARVLFRKSLGL